MGQSEVQTRNADAPRASIASLAQRPFLTDEDVTCLRRSVLRFGFVTRAEAEALFEIDAAPVVKCESWTALFVEAITDHVVWQSRPTGIVSSEQAEWVLSRAADAGTPTSLAALVNILAEAHGVPKSFFTDVRSQAANWPNLPTVFEGAQTAA